MNFYNRKRITILLGIFIWIPLIITFILSISSNKVIFSSTMKKYSRYQQEDVNYVYNDFNINRIRDEIVVETSEFDYDIDTIETANLNVGEVKMIRKGEKGKKEVQKHITYKGPSINNIEIEDTKIVKGSVNEIVLKGVDSDVPVFMVPSKGRYSSYFGERWNRKHKGVDIAAPIGTPIRASEGGKVVFSGEKGTYGNCIILKHKNGYETLYGHSSKLIAKKGDKINKGDIIAEVGNTGRSTGPHVHFEVKINGEHVDPMKYLD